MKRSWFGRTRRVGGVGLDIGISRTKVAKVSGRPEGLEVEELIDVPTPDRMRALLTDGMSDGSASELADFADVHGFAGEPVALVLSGEDAEVEYLSLLKADRDEMLAGLRREPAFAGEHRAWSKTVLDFAEVSPNDDGQVGVVAVAARRDRIRGLQQVAQEAGLNPSLVSAPTVALANAWSCFYRRSGVAGHRRYMVHAGVRSTMVGVIDKGFPLMSSWEGLGEVYLERQRRKKQAEVLDDGAQTRDSEVDAEVIDEWAGRIATKLQRSAMALRGQGFDKVLLSGGLMALPGAAEALGRRLDVGVQLFDVGAPVEWDAFVPAMALAFGASAELATRKEKE